MVCVYWELNNRFLQSIQFGEEISNISSPTLIPTVHPIDPAEYQGWWTYTHAIHGFSIRLPEKWIVEETTANDPLN
jgi:hypothetical protein